MRYLAFIFAVAVSVAFAHAAKLPDIPTSSRPSNQLIEPAVLGRQVEEDWLRQAKAIQDKVTEPLSTKTDARGACDGLKNGQYGFHTGSEANPWWQMDLGRLTSIRRIVVFNRLDYAPGLHNADHLRVLTSADGDQWTVRHENKAHFGGVSGAKPLEVTFAGEAVQARFVRLQVVSDTPIFFHLDEVEVYGPDAGSTSPCTAPPTRAASAHGARVKPLARATPPPAIPLRSLSPGAESSPPTSRIAGVDCAPQLQDPGRCGNPAQVAPAKRVR